MSRQVPVAESLGTGAADDLHSIHRRSIIENGKRTSVYCAAWHRGGAPEIIVDSGSVAGIPFQPHYLFSNRISGTVCGLNLSVIEVRCQGIDNPRPGRPIVRAKTLVPCENDDAGETDDEYDYVHVSHSLLQSRRSLNLLQISRPPWGLVVVLN